MEEASVHKIWLETWTFPRGLDQTDLSRQPSYRPALKSGEIEYTECSSAGVGESHNAAACSQWVTAMMSEDGVLKLALSMAFETHMNCKRSGLPLLRQDRRVD